MILVDTSIWIDHFRYGDSEPRKIMGDDRLLSHAAIIGRLALGSLRDRDAVLAYLVAQREAFVATKAKVMTIINRHSIFSTGIGYTDAHLLASTLLDRRSRLWTRDKRLTVAAQKADAPLHTPIVPPN